MVIIINGETIIDLHLKRQKKRQHKQEFHGLETIIGNDTVEILLLFKK
jgi:hypothetical protein